MTTLIERVDVRKLRWLLEHWDKFGEKVTSSRTSIEITKSILETYLQKLKIVPGTDFADVEVTYTSNLLANRMFSRNGTFLQGMSAVANHTISSGILQDWDMVNCHPTLLLQYCQHNKIKCDLLKEYVTDRDKFSLEVGDKDGLIETVVWDDKENEEKCQMIPVKVAILKSINGGKILADSHPKMIEMWHELDDIRDEVVKLNPKLYKIALSKVDNNGKAKNNAPGRTISYLMGELESMCLLTMKKFLDSQGVIIRVYCFDGLMIDQTKTDGHKITPEESEYLMEKMSDYVYNKTKYRVKIVKKEMTKGLDVPDDWTIEDEVKEGKEEPIATKNPIIGVYETLYVKVVNVPPNIKWCQDIEFPEGYTSIAIKQRLGGGKTTSIIKYINDERPKSVIYLSPRRTFARAITTELNSKIKEGLPRFKCYLDVPKGGRKAFRDNPYIVISMESLYWLSGSDTEVTIIPELLVVDEVHANLVQHTSIATNKNNFDYNVDYFRKLVERSPRKIFADAFLGQKFIRFISNLQIPTLVWNYLRPPRKKTCELVSYNDLHDNKKRELLGKKLQVKIDPSDHMMFKLLSLLDTGKKIYCVCVSKTKIDKWESIIRKKYPDKKIITYTGSKKADFSKGVNDIWIEYDLVMTTTTITVGISFDVLHFDCICLHVSSMSRNRIADVFQAHYRVRQTKDSMLYYSLDTWKPKSHDLPITHKGIHDNFSWLEAREISWRQNFIFLPKYLKGLFIDNTYDVNVSSMWTEQQTEMFLRECNYDEKKVSDTDLEDIDPVDISEEESSEIPFEDIPMINMVEMNLLMRKRRRDDLTTLEKLQIDKAMFVSCFSYDGEMWIKDKFCNVFWDIWISHGRRKIRNLSREYKDKNDIVTVSDLISRDMDISKYAGVHSEKTMQLQMIRLICNTLGIEHSNDTGAVIEGQDVKRAAIALKEEEKAMRKIFNIRDRGAPGKKKDPVAKTMQLTSQVLSNFGFSQLVVHKRSKAKNGCSSYIIKPHKTYKKKHLKNATPGDIYNSINITKRDKNSDGSKKPVIEGVTFESDPQ